jgi:hypothetical protein
MLDLIKKLNYIHAQNAEKMRASVKNTAEETSKKPQNPSHVQNDTFALS